MMPLHRLVIGQAGWDHAYQTCDWNLSRHETLSTSPGLGCDPNVEHDVSLEEHCNNLKI